MLCGHSLGGATVNHLALDLSEYAKDENIYAYTFASTGTTDTNDNRGNLFNLINRLDMVPWQNATGELRNGVDMSFEPAWGDSEYAKAFEWLTGKESESQLKYGAWDATLTISSKTLNNHVVESYMAALMSRSGYIEKWS